jgi:hypothetical protein
MLIFIHVSDMYLILICAAPRLNPRLIRFIQNRGLRFTLKSPWLAGFSQSHNFNFAASEIATTAGCFSLRSKEIAKKRSRMVSTCPITLTLYCR